MNKYIRALIVLPCGAIKMMWTKMCHVRSFKGPLLCQVSPFTELTLDQGAQLSIGKNFKMRDGAKIRVRKKAKCVIGNNTSINSNNMIACHEKIIIGNNVQFSPNVQIYDHDHDYKIGLNKQKFRTAPVVIGNEVWVGANTVILRGSHIGDGSVIGAGCVIKGDIPPNSIVVQKRELDIREYKIEV